MQRGQNLCPTAIQHLLHKTWHPIFTTGDEFCCQQVINNAFEQLLLQGFFQLEKGCQRLLDTLPKLGNHHFAQLGCHSSLKRELVGGLNHLRISGSIIFGSAAQLSSDQRPCTRKACSSHGSSMNCRSLLPTLWLSAATDWHYCK
jgi:hypothetical protein